MHLAVLVTVAEVKTPRLEVMEARGAVGLSIALTRGHPGLDIEFLYLRLAKVSSTDIDNPVGKPEGLDDFLRIGQDEIVLLKRFFIIVSTDHDLLDLVELVNPVEPPGISPRRSCLPAVTGRVARVEQRQG